MARRGEEHPPAPVPPTPTLTSLRRAAPGCRAWAVAPRLVVCLGATAAQSLLGSSFRVSVDRGRIFESGRDVPVMATVHPSSLLRMPDPETRQLEMRRFVADLRIAARFVARLPSATAKR